MSDAVVRYEPSAPVKSAKTLKDLLSRPDVQNSIMEIIPKHLTPERLIKTVLMAASRQPKLLDCTGASLLKCAMTSAELGLDCSGTLGRAYLVPYSREATFIVGYLGLADLARRSGEIESLDAQVVYKQDKFTLTRGLETIFIHEEDLFGDKLDADIVGAYFVAKFKDGGHHIEWMTRKQIDAIRSRSKAGNNGPWVTDYAAMCRKTVLRRGVKFCPLSIESQNMIAKAEEDEFVERPAVRTVERGSISLEDLSPVQTKEADDPPIDVAPSGPSVPVLWDHFLIDMKKKKLNTEGQAFALRQLADEYGTGNLNEIAEVSDPATFTLYLQRLTTLLSSEGYLK